MFIAGGALGYFFSVLQALQISKAKRYASSDGVKQYVVVLILNII